MTGAIIKSSSRAVPYNNVATVTGYTTSPTTVGNYSLDGDYCCLILGISGSAPTSNATTKTVTLPFPAANTNAQLGSIVRVIDNTTTTTVGTCVTRVNSNIMDLYPTPALGNWTASGTGRWNLFIRYQIAT